MLTLQQVLDKSKKAGVPINKRTFEYYQSLGFLPKPHRKVKGEKGRGVYGYYEPIVIDIVKKIYKLKNAGHSLNEIKEISKKEALEKCRKVIIDFGLSGSWNDGGILLGSPSTISGTNLTKFLTQVMKEGANGISSYFNNPAYQKKDNAKVTFEDSILEKVKWWNTKEEIEYEVVSHISDAVNGADIGIKLALEIIENPEENAKLISLSVRIAKMEMKALSRLGELEEIFEKRSKKKI